MQLPVSDRRSIQSLKTLYSDEERMFKMRVEFMQRAMQSGAEGIDAIEDKYLRDTTDIFLKHNHQSRPAVSAPFCMDGGSRSSGGSYSMFQRTSSSVLGKRPLLPGQDKAQDEGNAKGDKGEATQDKSKGKEKMDIDDTAASSDGSVLISPLPVPNPSLTVPNVMGGTAHPSASKRLASERREADALQRQTREVQKILSTVLTPLKEAESVRQERMASATAAQIGAAVAQAMAAVMAQLSAARDL